MKLGKANIEIAALTKKIQKGKSNTNSAGGGRRNKMRKIRNTAINIHGNERQWKHDDDDFYGPTVYCWIHGC